MLPLRLLAFTLVTTLFTAGCSNSPDIKPSEPKRDLSAYPLVKRNGKSVRLIPAADYLLWKEVPVPIAPSDTGISIVVNLTHQRVWLFQDGILALTSATCPGKIGHETPLGEFQVISKHKDWVSTLYHVPMPYFLRLNAANGMVGLHEGLIALQPASHGCIRLPAAMAKAFFEVTPIGSKVLITQDETPQTSEPLR